jgi:hypothetical protein
MRILFWGTPAYAVASLDALLAAGHELVGVVSQPDRRRGRGKALVAGEALGDELVVLEPGEGDVVIEAIEPCRVLLGSAVLAGVAPAATCSCSRSCRLTMCSASAPVTPLSFA